MTGVRATLVIPCLNEADGLPGLIERLDTMRKGPGGPWEILFVDDGSTDDTFRLLSDASAAGWLRVVRHPRNRGLGAALRTGFAEARAPIVVATDADLTCPFETLPALVKLVEDGADIACGSPWHPASGSAECGWSRKLLSRAASLLYMLAVRRRLYSWTCMCRAYRRSSLERIRFDADGFEAVTEILVTAALDRQDIREVPMKLGVRRAGESKMPMLRTIRGHLALLMRAVGRTNGSARRRSID